MYQSLSQSKKIEAGVVAISAQLPPTGKEKMEWFQALRKNQQRNSQANLTKQKNYSQNHRYSLPSNKNQQAMLIINDQAISNKIKKISQRVRQNLISKYVIIDRLKNKYRHNPQASRPYKRNPSSSKIKQNLPKFFSLNSYIETTQKNKNSQSKASNINNLPISGLVKVLDIKLMKATSVKKILYKSEKVIYSRKNEKHQKQSLVAINLQFRQKKETKKQTIITPNKSKGGQLQQWQRQSSESQDKKVQLYKQRQFTQTVSLI